MPRAPLQSRTDTFNRGTRSSKVDSPRYYLLQQQTPSRIRLSQTRDKQRDVVIDLPFHKYQCHKHMQPISMTSFRRNLGSAFR